MLKLYSYWRSSAAYRVRIALNLKGLPHEIVPVHLLKGEGEQRRTEYLKLNPQGLIPLLIDGEFRLNQSLAIFEYLESKHPQPALMPKDAAMRARMWAFCQAIACDIHPLNNLRVLQYLKNRLDVDEPGRDAWYRHWIAEGFQALEAGLQGLPESRFCFGDAPGFADCCLVPQMYNAERYQCPLDAYPRLMAISARLRELPAFRAAHPDCQPDKPPC
jgi:maleylacetoacetate isomerase